jgi:hypothetical protein
LRWGKEGNENARVIYYSIVI